MNLAALPDANADVTMAIEMVLVVGGDGGGGAAAEDDDAEPIQDGASWRKILKVRGLGCFWGQTPWEQNPEAMDQNSMAQ
ncbi:hypothetical protein AK812_SmicGene9718 [Symbiodinium microadriaticum]|uniref:Uncharacterized protein n=1 Tax=Symbiodinium microadriaticum TaxID=2951 RepID=A0A1Q9EHR9_SYMMI|nr:hypothetical protein AK812_SmicGene9718 [Symbiodinium microadriaticum]